MHNSTSLAINCYDGLVNENCVLTVQQSRRRNHNTSLFEENFSHAVTQSSIASTRSSSGMSEC